jgi:hypothetical protein
VLAAARKVRVPLLRGTVYTLYKQDVSRYTKGMKDQKRNQRAERAALAAERREFAADNARIAALYASGSLNRLPAAAPSAVAEPTRYTDTVLPSAVTAQARAAKAAATRRRNRAAR